MARGILFVAAFLGLCGAAPGSWATEAYLRVVDTGNSWCVVARTPEGQTFVYESGDRTQGRTVPCIETIRELAPERVINVLVVSREDDSQLSDLSDILREFEVRLVLHNREELSSTLSQASDRVLLVGDEALPLGSVFDMGSARVVYIAGWRDGSDARGPDENRLGTYAEHQLSTVAVQFVYGGHSVFISRASIGRYGSRRVCEYDQRIMIENADNVPVASDVIAVGYLALADCFREAAGASTVVIGTDWTRGRTQYHYGVDQEHLLSTAFTDCATGYGMDETQLQCRDRPGDDDVEIWLPTDGPIRVAYRNPLRLRR